MAFPTTSILDTFDRPDEGPPPSASWSIDITAEGSSSLFVAANVLGTSSSGTGWWNPTTFGPDSEGYFTVVTRGTSTIRGYLRIITPGTAGVDGYLFFNAAGSQTRIYRIDDQVITQLGADGTATFADGDSFGYEALGTNLTLYQKTGGTWNVVITRTDATYGGAGSIGLGEFSSSGTLDDFGGGTVAIAAADYTIINGTQSQLVNVNAGGTDVDAMSYKTTVSLTETEAAALASMPGVLVTADASPQQIRLIPKNIIRFQSS